MGQPPSNPFGGSQKNSSEQHKSDAHALMSKRVEAATRAMDVSKQIVRRSLDFQDDKRLRKVLKKGLEHDKSWQAAYKEFCKSKGLSAESDHKALDKDSLATFIERNMATSINEEWAKKVLANEQDEGKKE